MRLLRYYALSATVHERLWSQLDTVYFLRHDGRGNRLAHAHAALPHRQPTSRSSARASTMTAKVCR